jgi:hypothetical protein
VRKPEDCPRDTVYEAMLQKHLVNPQPNMTDEECLLIKLRAILREWNDGVEVKVGSNDIVRVTDGYNIWLESHNANVIITDYKINKAYICNDGSVYNESVTSRNDVGPISERWAYLVKGWNNNNLIPGEIAVKLTYRRFFAYNNMQIRYYNGSQADYSGRVFA